MERDMMKDLIQLTSVRERAHEFSRSQSVIIPKKTIFFKYVRVGTS